MIKCGGMSFAVTWAVYEPSWPCSVLLGGTPVSVEPASFAVGPQVDRGIGARVLPGPGLEALAAGGTVDRATTPATLAGGAGRAAGRRWGMVRLIWAGVSVAPVVAFPIFGVPAARGPPAGCVDSRHISIMMVRC